MTDFSKKVKITNIRAIKGGEALFIKGYKGDCGFILTCYPVVSFKDLGTFKFELSGRVFAESETERSILHPVIPLEDGIVEITVNGNLYDTKITSIPMYEPLPVNIPTETLLNSVVAIFLECGVNGRLWLNLSKENTQTYLDCNGVYVLPDTLILDSPYSIDT
ncbi:MAG: hypothetical protein F6K55_03055 [Moorea sp. SIO4A3]|nr:hypothetical protein [Moorena sp. SIO4A3]